MDSSKIRPDIFQTRHDEIHDRNGKWEYIRIKKISHT